MKQQFHNVPVNYQSSTDVIVLKRKGLVMNMRGKCNSVNGWMQLILLVSVIKNKDNVSY